MIARAGKPVARLVPAAPARQRAAGSWKGRVVIADDVDDTPADLVTSFHGGDVDPSPS